MWVVDAEDWVVELADEVGINDHGDAEEGDEDEEDLGIIYFFIGGKVFVYVEDLIMQVLRKVDQICSSTQIYKLYIFLETQQKK